MYCGPRGRNLRNTFAFRPRPASDLRFLDTAILKNASARHSVEDGSGLPGGVIFLTSYCRGYQAKVHLFLICVKRIRARFSASRAPSGRAAEQPDPIARCRSFAAASGDGCRLHLRQPKFSHTRTAHHGLTLDGTTLQGTLAGAAAGGGGQGQRRRPAAWRMSEPNSRESCSMREARTQ